MKKPALLLTVFLLLAGLAAGLFFGLKNMMERETRAFLDTLELFGQPTEVGVDAVSASPLTGTISIRGLTLRGRQGDAPIACATETVELRMPPRALLALTPLREQALGGQHTLTVADSVVASHIVWQFAGAKVTVDREEVYGLRATADLFRQVLEGQAIDGLDAFYALGADTLRSTELRSDIILEQKPGQLRLRAAEVKGWNGGTFASAVYDGLTHTSGGQEVLRLDRCLLEDLALPAKDLLRELLKQTAKGNAGTENLSALLERYAAHTPLAGHARIEGLAAETEGGTVALAAADIQGIAGAPRHTVAQVDGLHLPQKLIRQLLEGLDTPALDVSLRAEVSALDAATDRHAYTLKAPGLADVDCAFTMHNAGQLPIEQALLLLTVSDVQLGIQDLGLSAWVARNLKLEPAAATPVMHEFIAQLPLPQTPQNVDLLNSLRVFAKHPGKLELRTPRGRRIGLADLDLLAEKPSELLQVKVFPGSETLEAQMRALPPRQ